jgi:hypothetical protein
MTNLLAKRFCIVARGYEVVTRLFRAPLSRIGNPDSLLHVTKNPVALGSISGSPFSSEISSPRNTTALRRSSAIRTVTLRIDATFKSDQAEAEKEWGQHKTSPALLAEQSLEHDHQLDHAHKVDAHPNFLP